MKTRYAQLILAILFTLSMGANTFAQDQQSFEHLSGRSETDVTEGEFVELSPVTGLPIGSDGPVDQPTASAQVPGSGSLVIAADWEELQDPQDCALSESSNRGLLILAASVTNKKTAKCRVLRGNASWYGRQFHGKKTANGDRFNMNKPTAAHKTLPLGSRVRVTNLETGASVDVLVNDRGPYVGGRIIDLSRAAAKSIGMIEDGVTKVQVETCPQ